MRQVPANPGPPTDIEGRLRWLIDRVTQLCNASNESTPEDIAADLADGYQPLDDDLTAIAALTTTAFGRAFLAFANEAAFKAAVNLEASTDYYAPAGTDVALADGGTGASLVDPNADRILFWDDSAGTITWLEPSTGLEISGTTLQPTANARTGAIGFVIDGGGAAITTGNKLGVQVPFACTITGWAIGADQSGSIVIDVWKDTAANYPPTLGDTITAAAKPTISAAQYGSSTTLTGWTTSIAAGDWLFFNVDSVTSITKATISLTVLKS